MADLSDMQKQVVAFRNERKWQKWHDPQSSAISLILEAAELAEHFQWRKEIELKKYLSKHKEQIGDELIDVLYWVLLIAHDAGVDMEKAFSLKMQKNARKYPAQK